MELVDCTCGEPAIHNSGVENNYRAENTDSSRESSLPIKNGFHDGGLSFDNFLNDMDPVYSKCELKEMAIGKCSFSSSSMKDMASSGAKTKHLFFPGFLGKRPDIKSMKRIGEATSEL